MVTEANTGQEGGHGSGNAPRVLGVIEGFYGRPWQAGQRRRLFGQMAAWGMNTYLYAPKDDAWHRAVWRDPYPEAEEVALAQLVQAANDAGVQFVYALAPGLDLDWEDPADQSALLTKLGTVARLGVRHFALLFDDIPRTADLAAQALMQARAANTARGHLEGLGARGLFLFCPTEYCARRAVPSVGESPYLSVLGEQLHPDILVFWTGSEVISVDITAASVREVAGVLRRRPVLWDNLHANDYASRRVHLGPYAGRPLDLRAELSGILTNPNNQFEVNSPGLFSLAEYGVAESHWTPEASLERALAGWLKQFNTAAEVPVTASDLALLADSLYLPHRVGPRAMALHAAAQALLAGGSAVPLFEARATYRRLLMALERGTNRELLFDLHPFLVDLIEELSRLLREAGHLDPTEVNGVPFQGGLAERLTLIR